MRQKQTPQGQHIWVAQEAQQGFGSIGARQQGNGNALCARTLACARCCVLTFNQGRVQLCGKGGAFFSLCNAHAYVSPVGQLGCGGVQGLQLGCGLGAEPLNVRGQGGRRALGALADGRGQRQGAWLGGKGGIVRGGGILPRGQGGAAGLGCGRLVGSRISCRRCGRNFGGVSRAAGHCDRRQGKSSQHDQQWHANKQCTLGPHGLIFLPRWSGQSCAPWA